MPRSKKLATPSAQTLDEMRHRKPARRRAEVPADVHELLENGFIESKNLVEWLVVDRVRLAQNVLPNLGLKSVADAIENEVSKLAKRSPLIIGRVAGAILATELQIGDATWNKIATHPCDMLREWGAWHISHQPSISLKKRFAAIKQFADDPNPGVREIAWIALRDHVAEDVPQAIALLEPWTSANSDRIRRFPSEITRPCGVWAAHIPSLKKNPEPGLSILLPLRSDNSKYVRDSVANWLNDASKSQPDWVREVTEQWLIESPTAETRAIVKRAMRTLTSRS